MKNTFYFFLTVILAIGLFCNEPTHAQVDGRVESVAGRPVIMAGDEVLTSSSCDRFPWRKRMHDRNKQFAKAGVQLFQLMLRGDNPDFYTTGFWTDENEYGDSDVLEAYASLDKQANAILSAKPDAWFCISFFTAPPKKFAERYPEHMQTGDGGKRYRAASYASDLWLDGQCEMLRRLVKFCESRPWGARVIGYVCIPHTEGVTNASVYGDPFDQSQVMRDAYADYVQKKYNVDTPPSTLPTVSQWQAERKQWLTFTTPSQTQRYLDYFALQRDLLHRFVVRVTEAIKQAATRKVFVTVDALKQPLQGWMILDAFEANGDGMEFFDILLTSGSYDVARSLDIPTLDGLMTPADYTSRSVGWGFGPEGIGDSMVLRGKVMMLENDARTWIDESFKHNQGAFRNVAQGRAGLLRNFSSAISRGYFAHWCNVGRGFFDDEQVMQLVKEVMPLRARMGKAPHAHTEHAIAMIIDDTAPLYTDFTSGFHQLAVLQQRVQDLALTGLPYRVYLFSDLKRDDFPKFRAYLFPNLLKVTPERIALLREKVLCDGSIAIFGPATGITDGKSLTAEPARQLLGIPLELVAKRAARKVLVHAGSHPAVADVRGPVTYGDSYQFGPILQPAYDLPEDVTVLGKASILFSADTAGLVLKETDDAKIVFSVAMPLPASLLRSLALYGGVTPWSDLGDVVHASGNFLSVHSIRPGKRHIRLPATSRVEDLQTGELIFDAGNRFEITLKSPDTRVFSIQETENELQK